MWVKRPGKQASPFNVPHEEAGPRIQAVGRCAIRRVPGLESWAVDGPVEVKFDRVCTPVPSYPKSRVMVYGGARLLEAREARLGRV